MKNIIDYPIKKLIPDELLKIKGYLNSSSTKDKYCLSRGNDSPRQDSALSEKTIVSILQN